MKGLEEVPMRAMEELVARVLDAVAPNIVTSVLLLAAALVLVSGLHAGLYVPHRVPVRWAS